ncbi:unnamed protein product [Schistosoma bovis]|nr:unnamed protein product [Schistosoma bovis]CAH8469116.1 unnamed protein product [Schistosoma intercalatum]CAH8451178.1 unnamed protein product [Schistosoma bovis]CAH8451194.1 unnamed protein product [Schistosoma bovis]CAH8469135.1 unnamed protein product [Schistosoma intercalatum]
MYWPGDAIVNNQVTQTTVYSCHRSEAATQSTTSYRISNLLKLIPTCLNQVISNLTGSVNSVVDLH